jgi:hypothetical protein
MTPPAPAVGHGPAPPPEKKPRRTEQNGLANHEDNPFKK